jgi:predicted DCC family thiol-disulfide oxidoreductase YuxK
MASPLVFLYDGQCKLCLRGAALMRRVARPGRLEVRDFQQPEGLVAYPQVTYEQCMEAAQLVNTDGQAWSGLEAIVRALMTRPLLGLFARAYYLPGLRQLGDALYRWVAANRYRFLGREACDDNACQVHLRPPGPKPRPASDGGPAGPA